MSELTPAELRAIRAGLGLTAEWLADHVGVRVRAVQRWESGVSPIREGIVDAVLLLEQQAAEQVAEEVEVLRSQRPGLPPVLAIEDGGPGDWPAGWQRQIAFRVRQQVPGMRIVDVDDAP